MNKFLVLDKIIINIKLILSKQCSDKNINQCHFQPQYYHLKYLYHFSIVARLNDNLLGQRKTSCIQ